MNVCDYPHCRDESGIRLAKIGKELCWEHYNYYCNKRAFALIKLGVDPK